MTSRRFALATLFALGLLGSAWLWRFWTPRCNEACPAWLATSMYAILGVLPIASAAVGAIVMAAKGKPRGWLMAVAVFSAFASLVVWMTLASA